MNKIKSAVTAVLVAASALAVASTADARPHRHQVCTFHHHHRVCRWR